MKSASPCNEHRFRVLEIRDQANGDHRHFHRCFDCSRERHLITGTDRDLLRRCQSAAGNVNGIAASRFERLGEFDGLLDIPAIRRPIRSRDANAHWLFGRDRGADRIEHFERKAHAILERAAVFVMATIR